MEIIPLPLALIKRQSVLDGLEMYEVLPLERIKALIKSPHLLLTEWSNESTGNSGYTTSEKTQLKEYQKKYNKQVGAVLVKYKKPKHQWGRSFPTRSHGLSSIRREVRTTLIEGLYYDCDIQNCQPNLITALSVSNGIPCPIITRYCKDRPAVLEEVQKFYNVDRNTAKQLFLRLCFHGSFVGWALENKIQKPPLEFITLFERELRDICQTIKKVNPSLYETARKKKEADGVKTPDKITGSFFGLYNQEYESRIVEQVLCYLINQTDLMKLEGTSTPVGTYEYDGIKLLKANVDAYEGGIDAVIELLNEKTLELTGFHLDWASKPIDGGYDITEWLEQVTEEDKPDELLGVDCEKINRAINNADAGIVETLMEILPNHFIYSVDKADGSKGEWYGWNGDRWEKSEAPLRKAIIYEIEKYWTALMAPWDEIYGKMEPEYGMEPDPNYLHWKKTKEAAKDRIFQLKSSGGITNVANVAKTLMANYTLEFDTKEDLVGFENGVYDIAEDCFRPFRFDDYITWSCGYDFTPNLVGMKVMDNGEMRVLVEGDIAEEYKVQEEVINGTYKQIFPDEELRGYFWKVISTGISGRAIEKFFVFNGAGRNGKGLTNEFLEVVYGDYFTTVSPTIYSENQKTKSSAGANPEIAKLHLKRYIVAKEPQKDAPLHNSVIKDLTGGGNTSARMLYSSKTTVKLCGTNVMECNEKPPFSEAPKDADAERINDVEFVSKFCNAKEEWDETTGLTNYIFPLDAGLKETLKNSYRNTMMNMIIRHLRLVREKNYNVDAFKPESVKKRSMAYLQNSYDIHKIFQSIFEKRCEDNVGGYLNWKGDASDEDWSLSKIAQALRKCPEFYDLEKKKQKEYKAEVIEEFFRKNSFYKSSVDTNTNRHCLVLKGWRLKPKMDNEDDYEC